jgi:FlaA1/EpsC-like NDP-sugar epimerase
LIGDRKTKISITGVRPGEKMHEIMVSEEEMHHCVKRGDYYAIKSMLPELSGDTSREKNALSQEFSSADNVLSLEGTRRLLRQHGLTRGLLGPQKELLR